MSDRAGTPSRRPLWVAMALMMTVLLGACSETTRTARSSADWWRLDGQPDELPQMVNPEPPFRYPLPEYTRRVEGNVLLRLFVDTAGVVVPDSTRVSESSGSPALDRAALAGATSLRFRPARRRGAPIAVSVHFPVHFRHADEGTVSPSRKDSTERR